MDSNNWRIKPEPTDQPPREITSQFQQRRANDGFRGFGSYRGARPSQRGGRFQGEDFRQTSPRDNDQLRKPLDDAQANLSIEEGRRLYVGNLSYEATVKDVESVFKDVASGIQSINMSVDPMTGRNPSYCFIDFETRELAEQVMATYNGLTLLRRPLKIKPGVKSGRGRYVTHDTPQSPQRKLDNNPVAYDRWQRVDDLEDRNLAPREGRRLYVGGLPRFVNQKFTTDKMLELFKGYTVEVVSKEVSAHEATKDLPGNHNYCFVDLATVEEAKAAIKELNGKGMFGGELKVHQAYGTSGKLAERRRLFVGALPEFKDQESTDAGMKELFGNFELKIISKLFLPKEVDQEKAGNHCYCFVELADEEQTDAAILELNWKEMWGSQVSVKPAISTGRKAEKIYSREPNPRGRGSLGSR